MITIVNNLYARTLDDFWPSERRLVENGYRDIQIPMDELPSPDFHMEADWKIDQLLGYLTTWSAVKRYHETIGNNPVEAIADELIQVWGDQPRKTVRWPLTLRIWKN